MDFKEQIAKLLEEHGVANALALLEVPPNTQLGDYALPCFTLAKELKKAPLAIAQELSHKMSAPFIAKVVATGPYINFFINSTSRAEAVIGEINAGTFWKLGKGTKKIMIEYPSPNTNKPLHLGHVRNMVLGSTIATLYKNDGNNVIQVNLINDRGVHICKSMLAYERWGNNIAPNKKSDHFVGDYYVLFQKHAKENLKLEEEAQEMLVKWEQEDPKIRALWKKMNGWALEGHEATYRTYGVAFDKEYYESDIYMEGKQIVLDHLDILERDESGAVIANLEQFKLPNKVLLRKDGTTIYMTQDIALTIKKMEEFAPDLQIWVVANEQALHFQQLFAILELFGVKGRESFFHLNYGMVALPEGRMKSREGTVIDGDDIFEEVYTLAFEEIQKRHNDWDDQKISNTAQVVAMCAIKFFMIKYDPMRDFVYDPKSSLSFEGDTGPYLQYTHARICSIITKAGMNKKEISSNINLSTLATPEEQELLRQLESMPNMVRHAIDEIKPSLVANQLLEIARAFNSFYHACPVLNAPTDVKTARIALIDATRQVINDGLALLNITAPDEM